MTDRQEDKSTDKLFKGEDNTRTFEKDEIEAARKKTRDLWVLLSVPSSLFNAQDATDELLVMSVSNFRLMYSQFSANFYNIDERERSNVLTNIDSLVNHIHKNANDKPQLIKMAIKIYDHCQLASQQIESIQKMSAINVEKARDKLEEETKGMEKEYISILGIFASVVLAFMGGISYSSSVLSAINKAPILRLVLVIDLLGFVLTNVIYVLLDFIAKINSKHNEKTIISKNLIIFMNIIYLVAVIAVIFIHLVTELDI